MENSKKPSPLFQSQPIAIVGIGCIFPGAPGTKAYWRLLYHKQDAIQEVPETHWSPQEYFHADPRKPDHVYCKHGAFLSPISFDPAEFGIPPASLEATDTSQLLALITAKTALEDAGYGQDAGFDRDRVSVILGVTGTQELVIPLGARLGHPLWRKALARSGVSDAVAEEVIGNISAGYVSWQENSFPGLLGNVVAGRICNRLNLGGTNCVVDAACASSMGALHLSLLELQAGRSDMVVTGGVDAINDIFMTMCFSKTMILSPTGDIRPFSQDADGTVLGEGVGMVVLKRLADAEKDGDNVYAVIKAVGSSSDGRAQSIYAPRSEGQTKAIQMAYDTAGIPAESIGLIEAHGTGTRIGDQVEFSSLRQVFSRSPITEKTCAIGSVKSMIGHTKAAAGAAGLIKAALALKNKVILPTLKADPPDPKLEIETSPFYISRETRPWFSHDGHPRRAGVSSFGFGGSNFHVVLEEHRKEKQTISWDGSVAILPLSADNPEQLSTRLRNLKARIAEETAWLQRNHIAAELRRDFNTGQAARLIFIHDQSKEKPDDNSTSLLRLLDRGQEALQRFESRTAWHQKDIFFGSNTKPAKLAFLFPGQGSQYADMGKDLACTFPEMMQMLEKLNERVFLEHGKLTDLIFPLQANDPQYRNSRDKALQPTEIAQPAIGGLSVAFVRILKRFGITPDAVCGHSFGELSALFAAGWMDEDTLIDLAVARGKAMATAARAGNQGAMLAVRAPLDRLTAFVQHAPELTLANLNSPEQGVLSGPAAAIEAARQALQSEGFHTTQLPVSAAFHSRWMKPAAASFLTTLKQCRLTPGPTPVLSNSTGSLYPVDPDRALEILGRHLLEPVQFKANIEQLYSRGIELFLEVGPRSVLTGLVKAILKTEDIHALSVDASAGKDFGVADLARALALTASLGYPVQFEMWEDPVPARKHQHMRIPICGANYRSPEKKHARKIAADAVCRQPSNSAASVLKTPKPQPKQASRLPNCTATATSREFQQQSRDNNKMSQPMIREKKAKDFPTPANTWRQSAVRMVQEGLAAMQALQAQTTEAHKKFLETQSEASRTLQKMMESARYLADPALGPEQSALEAEYAPRTIPDPASAVSKTTPNDHRLHGDAAATRETDAADAQKHAEESVTAPVSAPETPAGSDLSHVTQPLLAIVSELTGYPVEMLDLEMDIEADLGIDSIKRVEILSTLEERLPDLPAISPDMMGTLKTLGQIVEFLAGNPDANSAAAVETDQPAAGQSVVDTRGTTAGPSADVIANLLAVVSELTGYPVEMLDLKMDIEADLGIDSIKRVEILSTLEERLPHLPAISPDMMGTLKTLGQISTFLTSPEIATQDPAPVRDLQPLDGSSASESLISAPDKAEVSSAKPQTVLQRSILTAAEAPLVRSGPLRLPETGRIYVVDDAAGLSAEIVRAFHKKNIQADLLLSEQLTSLLKGKDDISDAAGLVIVASPAYRNDADDDRFLRHAFLLAKCAAAPLQQAAEKSGALFATVSRLDGMFGLKGNSIKRPITGGLAGLLKTAAIEWSGVACRALDICPDWNDIPAAADAVTDELLYAASTSVLEIGISPTQRHILQVQPLPLEPLEAMQLNLDPTDVVLISGGARGVTAAAAVALARHIPAKFALIGRSSEPFTEPAWLSGLNDPAEMKRAILVNEFNNNGASPKDIERSYRKYTANREISQTLHRLRQAGAEVRYCSADIRDAGRIESLLEEIRSSLGPIRAVIHGAGVIDDRRISDKTLEQFTRVYDTKVLGLRALLEATRNDDLRYLVIFSSVAARFGNQGQVDYAMANEVLNKTARLESCLRKHCRVVSINWGPWDGGMVSPSLKREFIKNQVELIPLQTGAAYLLKELAQPPGQPVETIIEAHSDPRFAEQMTQSPAAPARMEPAAKTETANLSLLFKREIDTAEYPILDAHRLDGKPVVPFALLTEWFGHGALHENPGLLLHGIDDMRILKGIKLEKPKKVIRMFAGKANKKGALYEVPVELRDGVLEGVDVIHSRARAILVDTMPDPPPMTINEDFFAGNYRRSIEEIYEKILFHGNALRGIQKIIAASPHGMAANVLSAPLPAQWMKAPLRSSWISDPLALDCAFQLATLWCYEETGSVSLPSYCKEYRQYCTKFPAGGITAVLEVLDVSAHKMTGNITLLSGEKSVVARLIGYEAVIDPSLYRAFKPHLA